MSLFGVHTSAFEEMCSNLDPPLWGAKVFRRFGYPHNQLLSARRYAIVLHGEEDFDGRFIELTRSEWDRLVQRKAFVYHFVNRLQMEESAHVTELFGDENVEAVGENGWVQATLRLHLHVDITFIWNSGNKSGYIQLDHRTNDESFVAKVEDFLFLYENWVGPIEDTMNTADQENPAEEPRSGTKLIGDTQADLFF